MIDTITLTGSIPIPVMQTYCTCLTKLTSDTKNVPVQILKGFVGTTFWGGRLQKYGR
jgi:hypothetical protein